MMESKKQMISELTNTAWSLVNEYYLEYVSGRVELDSAKHQAALRVGKMRYGSDEKDYFWITDMEPYMIMHPYRQDLIGKDLSDYQDPDGKKLFVDAVKAVKLHSEGFIDYMWQWKDDSTLIVPKLSYVKAFDEWNWIIGTGIYLEDVKKEVSDLQKNLFRITFLILLVILMVLLFIIRQSMLIEKKRLIAEKNLQHSRLKYKTLAESSTISTVMMHDKKVIYANQKFLDLIGFSSTEILTKEIIDLFGLHWDILIQSFTDPGRSVTFETKINNKHEVLLSVSKVKFDNDYSYIFVVNELTKANIYQKHYTEVLHSLKSSLLLMKQPVSTLIEEGVRCEFTRSISEAIQLIKRKSTSTLFITQQKRIIGIVSASDLLLRTDFRDKDLSAPIVTVMSSPVVSVDENAMVGEAISVCRNKKVSYLVLTNELSQQCGVVSFRKLLLNQSNYIADLYSQIATAETINALKQIYANLPVLIEMFVASGAKQDHITNIVSLVADKITSRVIDLIVEEEGQSPCEFCFIVMGSLGRKEQTLITDQDNGIIIDNSNMQEEYKDYFLTIGKRINDALHTIGYNYCRGNIMSGNPQWNTTLKTWKNYFSNWVINSDSQSLIDVNIFFDFRPVYGKFELADELREHLNKVTLNEGTFFYQLAKEIIRFKSPIGLFGEIHGEHDSSNAIVMDIKKLIMPVTSFSRLYALKNTISAPNTISRLNGLRNLNDMNPAMIYDVHKAYDMLMNLRIKAQLNAIQQGENPSNEFDINQLGSIEKVAIKKALGVISDLITKVKLDFREAV